jgi:hypothetical protein
MAFMGPFTVAVMYELSSATMPGAAEDGTAIRTLNKVEFR